MESLNLMKDKDIEIGKTKSENKELTKHKNLLEYNINEKDSIIKSLKNENEISVQENHNIIRD